MKSACTLIVIMIIACGLAGCDKKSNTVTPKVTVNLDSTVRSQYPDTSIYIGALNDSESGEASYFYQVTPFTFYTIRLNDSVIVFINNTPINIYDYFGPIDDTFKIASTNTYTFKATVPYGYPPTFTIINDSLHVNWQCLNEPICSEFILEDFNYGGKLQVAAAR